MKKIKIISVVLMFFVVTSCGSDSEDYIAVYKNDMDTQLSWTDNPFPHLIRNPNARSGMYVCRLDSMHAFSPTFNMTVSRIATEKFTKVKVSAWIKAEDLSADVHLVVDIHDGNNNSLEWLAKNFTGPALNKKDWEKYEFEVNLSENDRFKETNILRIYVSNGKSTAVLCDDIEIAFY